MPKNTSGFKRNQLQRKLNTRFEFINSLQFRGKNIYDINNNLNYDIDEIKNIISELQENYNQYIIAFSLLQNIQSQVMDTDVLSQINLVLTNDINGSNLASSLINDQNNLASALKMYDKYYQKFFESFNKSIDILEKTSSSLRGEKNLFHIGMNDENNLLKEFSLDDASMSQFRRDQSIFKLQMSKDGQVRMTSKAFLERNSIIDSLQKAVGGENIKTLSRYGVGEILSSQTTQKGWFEYMTSQQLRSKKTNGQLGASLRMGRRYEAFDEGMISSEGVFSHLTALQSNGYFLDQLPWTAGQDNSKFDWISGTQYGIQNKFFKFNDAGNTGKNRIGISSITTIFDSLDLLSKPNMLEDRYMYYTEQSLSRMSEDELFTELYAWQGQGNYKNPYLSTYNDAIENFGNSMIDDLSDFGFDEFSWS